MQPILAAIDVIAAYCDSCWLVASLTMRTARSMTSGESLGCFFIVPFLKEWSRYKAGPMQYSCDGKNDADIEEIGALAEQ